MGRANSYTIIHLRFSEGKTRNAQEVKGNGKFTKDQAATIQI